MAERAVLLHGFIGDAEADLIAVLRDIVAEAPFRRMMTPGGHQMSVAMTNCGSVGWVTDHSGYRYSPNDPETGKPWPEMPPLIADIASRAARAAGFAGFSPEACLINRYVPGARMSLHQDKDEHSPAPVVSLSLGDSCVFRFGNTANRKRPWTDITLHSGDLFVFGGPARFAFHGVTKVHPGTAPAGCGLREGRINVTMRVTGLA